MATAGAEEVSSSQNAARSEARPAPRVVVTGTGFSSHEKEVLHGWVLQLGVQYSGDLVCRFSTHLVCKDLLAAFNEPKYVKAVHWGITIVSFRWVYDSLQAGRLLPTAGYKSDVRGPADIALRDAIALRRQQVALQQAARAPLRQVNESVYPGRTFPTLGPPNSTRNDKRHLVGGNQEAEAQHDFTFDVPSGSGVLSSPRLCHNATPGQARQNDVSGCHLFDAVKAAGEARTREVDVTVEPTVVALSCEAHSPLRQHPSTPTTQMPTPSIEVSFSMLSVDVTITAAAKSEAENADNSTPTSGVNYDDSHNKLRCTAAEPKRLDMPLGPCEQGIGDQTCNATTSRAISPRSPAPSGTGEQVEVECVDLLTPKDPPARAPAASALHSAKDLCSSASLNAFEHAAPVAGQHAASGTGVLYSGFDLPLAAVATAAKSRRLVRTDRMVVAVTEGTARDDADKDLEDDLEDSLDKYDKPKPDGTRGVPPFVAPPRVRPSLTNCTHSVKALVNVYQPAAAPAPPDPRPAPQQQQQQQQQRVNARHWMGSRVHDDRHLGNVQLPPSSAAAPIASEGFSCSAQPEKQPRAVHTQQEQQTGRLPAQRPDQASVVAGVPSSVRVKPEPGFEAEQNGPVGRVAQQAPHAAQLGLAGSNSVTVAHPGAGRRPAALLMSSLVSEPQAMAPRPGGRASAAERASHGFFGKPDGAADGYESSYSSGLTSSVVDGVDVSTGQCSSYGGSAPLGSYNRYDCPQPALGDGATLKELEGEGRALGNQRASKLAPAGPKTIKRLVSRAVSGFIPLPTSQQREIMPEAVCEDGADDDFVDTSRGGRGTRLFGHSRERNAATVKPLPRAASGKASHKRVDQGTGAAKDIENDTLDAGSTDQYRDGDDEGDDIAPAPLASTSQGWGFAGDAESSFASGLTQSRSSQQVEPGSESQPWSRVTLTDDKSISKHLRMSVEMAEKYLRSTHPLETDELLSDNQIQVVKVMGRPKTHTVKDWHPGVALKLVQFAEQIQLEPLQLQLNCRDKTKRSRCPIIALGAERDEAEGGEGREIFLAEPLTIYRLPNGEWWLEYSRFFSISDLKSIAAATGRRLSVPKDFNDRRELMRDVDTEHCRIIHVRGNLGIMRTKKPNPPPERGQAAGSGRPAFWRFNFDKVNFTPVVHDKVTDMVYD